MRCISITNKREINQSQERSSISVSYQMTIIKPKDAHETTEFHQIMNQNLKILFLLWIRESVRKSEEVQKQ